MSVRPHPTKGPGWWYIEWYPEGKAGGLKRIPFEGTELEAREWELDLRRQMKGQVTGPLPSINEVVPHYVEWYRNNHQPAGTERTIRSLKHLLPFFGKYQFTSISHALVEQYKTIRLQHVKPTTIQKELATLSGLCKYGHRRGYCPEIKIDRFPQKLTKAPLPDVLTREEVLQFLDGFIDEEKRTIFATLYYAGLRKSEARSVTVENCFLGRGIMIVRGKGNKQRPVPISSALVPMIEQRIEEVKSGPLFPNMPKDLRELIFWAKKRAKITKKITPHMLRHCFGVHSIQAGVNLRSLQLVMGHSSSQVTEGYTHLAATALVEEMKKFD